jgi:hypothetical protein
MLKGPCSALKRGAGLSGRARELFPAPFKLKSCTMVWESPNMAHTSPATALCGFCTSCSLAVVLL